MTQAGPARPQGGEAALDALAGLRVLEIGGDVAVRYCGRLFAQMGAAVVRAGAAAEDAAPFEAWLDQGKSRAGEGRFDLVLAGQTPSDAAAAEQVARALPGSPTLLALTWFAPEGPYADWAGNDALIHALTGVAYTFGLPDGPPTLAQGHSPQTVAGVTAIIAAMAGLMRRERPRRIDVNVLEAAMCFTETGAVATVYSGLTAQRLGVNRYMPTYPASIYRASDGWVGITTLTPEQWRSFCGVIGRPELAVDPRFTVTWSRLMHADAIDEILTPLIAQRTTADWVAAGDVARIPITPVVPPGELPREPHWEGRGSFTPLAGVEAPNLPFVMAFDGIPGARPQGPAEAPLAGVRVADFSMGWAGPLAARLLADLGADVLKIESQSRPDWWRGWEPIEGSDPPSTEVQRNFMCVNRNKRGLDLDLSNPQGLARAKAVIAASDVVIENLGPGVMARLGLAPADQRALRGGIISLAMPPFGRRGPLSGVRAYGSTVEQASGMPFVNGQADWAPCQQHVAYGDPVAGLYAAAAVLAALWGRERLGGADIELCQVECLFQLGAAAIIDEQASGAPSARTGNRRASAAPSCVVSAGADSWLAVVVDSPAAWRALCAVLGRPSWASLTLEQRMQHADEIEAALAAWAEDRVRDEAAAALQAAGVPAAPVQPTHTLCDDPQLVASDYFVLQQRRYVGEHLTPNAPWRMDGARPPIRRAAPVLGEHTDEVLAGLGVTAARAAGHIDA
jgi:crotonobetainyl-CoA:carnitine CoA-transferase CaiB-like acyl-CoA transferase